MNRIEYWRCIQMERSTGARVTHDRESLPKRLSTLVVSAKREKKPKKITILGFPSVANITHDGLSSICRSSSFRFGSVRINNVSWITCKFGVTFHWKYFSVIECETGRETRRTTDRNWALFVSTRGVFAFIWLMVYFSNMPDVLMKIKMIMFGEMLDERTFQLLTSHVGLRGQRSAYATMISKLANQIGCAVQLFSWLRRQRCQQILPIRMGENAHAPEFSVINHSVCRCNHHRSMNLRNTQLRLETIEWGRKPKSTFYFHRIESHKWG